MSKNTEKKSLDPNVVIVAVIGLVGTIIAALIGVYGNRPSTSQPTPFPPTAVVYTEVVPPTSVPTDAVAVGEPSSTPAPATLTPEPVPTATLLPAGADWQMNCISSLWVPFPSSLTAESDDAGCLKQPIGTFYTSTGRLAFSVNERASSAQIYGLFVKLPADGTVSVDTQLTTVTTGEVLMGIFEKPDISSNGALVVIPESKDVKKKQLFILKTMPGQKEYSHNADLLNADPAIYNTSFDFTPGAIKVKVGETHIDLGSITVVSSEKWLFLGYQVYNGTNVIQSEFLNLNIQSR